MPGFVKTPKDEARWAKAKEAARKQTSEGSESFWKLSNYIYHKMGKSDLDAMEAKSAYDKLDKTEKLNIENLKHLDIPDMPVQQSIMGNEVENMSNEKKYSAKEAAVAVLKKAEELLKKHEVMKKAANPFSEEEGKAPKGEIQPKEETQGESVNPGERVEEKEAPQPTQENPKVNSNPQWGDVPGSKGHFKLAKFCGHMESKRKSAKPAAPAGVV